MGRAAVKVDWLTWVVLEGSFPIGTLDLILGSRTLKVEDLIWVNDWWLGIYAIFSIRHLGKAHADLLYVQTQCS